MADVDKPIIKDSEDKQYQKPHSVLRPAILTNHVSYEGPGPSPRATTDGGRIGTGTHSRTGKSMPQPN